VGEETWSKLTTPTSNRAIDVKIKVVVDDVGAASEGDGAAGDGGAVWLIDTTKAPSKLRAPPLCEGGNERRR
jgi:hypothetical protein